jgi:hypothetical protein
VHFFLMLLQARSWHPYFTKQCDNLLTANSHSAQANRPTALEPCNVIMRRSGFRWSLIRGELKAKLERKCVQLINIVCHEVTPFTAFPNPNGIIHIDSQSVSLSIAQFATQDFADISLRQFILEDDIFRTLVVGQPFSTPVFNILLRERLIGFHNEQFDHFA